ncbi:oligosaccharide flippase family protein [Agathobacter sp.]
MNSYKYLLKNIGLLTLSSFATKLLSFFLVPLYTNILTTTEYGTYDLFNASIGVILPVLTLNIQEAVLRFAIDKKTSRNAIVTISFKYLLISNFIVLIGLVINGIWGLSNVISDYGVLFFLMFFVQSLSGIIVTYIRGIDRIAELSVSSVIASIITITCNILFLVVFRWKLVGYFLANIIGPFIQCLYLIIRSDFYRHIKIKKYSSQEKEMLKYSRPLIANSIAWWVNNVSDRYVVIFFCGLAENGIYSVAGKIPSILNIFQSIFNSAWTLSAVKDFDPEDKNGFFSNTYKAYNCMLTIICSLIIVFDKTLAHFLYAKDFYIAWKYVPWLTIAILFGALSGYIGGFFSAVKDSKIFATSTILGAVTNLVLNFIFTPVYGALGAAVATAVCYFVVWLFRFYQSRKYIKIKVNLIRDILTYFILVLQSLSMLFLDNYRLYVVVNGLFIFLLVLYFRDIKVCIKKIIRR